MPTDVRGDPTADAAAGTLTPAEHLRAEIERLGLDQVAVSEATGVSRQSINYIVNGRQPISRAMAAKLGRLTGHEPDYWLRASFPRPGAAVTPGTVSIEEKRGQATVAARGSGVLVNHQIIRAIKDGVITIDPFDEANVQLASIDLSLNDFIDTMTGEHIDVTDGQSFVLRPGQTVIVTTKEWVRFPQDYIGRVGAMTSLSRCGIMTSHGLQIDPGFQGDLQFCLFNAGGQDFELHGGMPIISIEIVPLNEPPSPDERAAKHVRDAVTRDNGMPLRYATCERLIHDALRARVNVAKKGDKTEARIPELDLAFEAHFADAAIEAVVQRALTGLRFLRTHPQTAREEHTRYAEFFGDIADRLHLDAEQTRRAVLSLGFPIDTKDAVIVSLRDGKEILLQLPPRHASLSLTQLARQLREDAGDLLLMLAGVRRHLEASLRNWSIKT